MLCRIIHTCLSVHNSSFFATVYSFLNEHCVFFRTYIMSLVTNGSGRIDPCSVDVLNLLFNNDDGILTQDCDFHPEKDDLQLPDLGLVRQNHE